MINLSSQKSLTHWKVPLYFSKYYWKIEVKVQPVMDSIVLKLVVILLVEEIRVDWMAAAVEVVVIVEE